MHCDHSHLNMKTIPVYCQQVCIKEIVHKKRRKAQPFILAAKTVYNKTTKGKYNIISPDFLFQPSRLMFLKILQVLTLVVIEC